MRDLAPDIFRQRLLIEGYYSGDMTSDRVRDYLLGVAAHLNLRTYADPIVFVPASGMGREENAGFDAFVPLIDSGISAYSWSKAEFFSRFALHVQRIRRSGSARFTAEFFRVQGDTVSQSV